MLTKEKRRRDGVAGGGAARSKRLVDTLYSAFGTLRQAGAVRPLLKRTIVQIAIMGLIPRWVAAYLIPRLHLVSV